MYIASRESKPPNSDFYQNDFFQRGNTNRMAHILSNSRSFRLIRTPLKHQSCLYRIYEKFHYFAAHFPEIRAFAMRKMLKMSLLDGFSQKNGQNDVTQVKLFIMTVKSLLKAKNTNNNEF